MSFFLAGSRDSLLPSLVPVPLGDLVEGHTYLSSYLNLKRVRPVRVIIKVCHEYDILILLLANVSAFLPLFIEVKLFHLSALFH